MSFRCGQPEHNHSGSFSVFGEKLLSVGHLYEWIGEEHGIHLAQVSVGGFTGIMLQHGDLFFALHNRSLGQDMTLSTILLHDERCCLMYTEIVQDKCYLIS